MNDMMPKNIGGRQSLQRSGPAGAVPTGDLELSLTSLAELDTAKLLILAAYEGEPVA